MGYSHTCWRCQLDRQLTDLLGRADGTIPDQLQPLVDALLGLPQPRVGYVWIRRNTTVQSTLRQLASGDLPLDHDTFDQMSGRTTEYLRGLLVEHGCLPRRDRYLSAFETWLTTKLDQITDPDDRRHIDAFTRWQLLRQLRNRTQREPVPAGAFLNAKQVTTVAIDFLNWLHGRGHHLESATQADLDTWYATGPSTRRHVTRLLAWARQHKISQLSQTQPPHDVGKVTGERERLEQLKRLLEDRTLPPTPRLIGLLVLLFGQPVAKIVRLPRDSVTVDDAQPTITLGNHTIELPEPVAVVVRDHLDHITHGRSSAAQPRPKWLFPGLQPGQPLHVYSASRMLKSIGLSARAARNGAWQQLVHQAPAAILADGLGAGRGTVTRHANTAAADYANYRFTEES